MCPDWVIYWTLGNFSKPLATIKLPKSSPFLDNFWKVSKSSIFLVKSFLGSFYRYLATFTGHTASHYNDAGSFKNHKNQEEPTAQVPKDGRELNVRTTILVETQGRYPSVTRYWNKRSPKFCTKWPHQFSLKIDVFQNKPTKSLHVWAPFVRKFFAKNFQESPNLVTL